MIAERKRKQGGKQTNAFGQQKKPCTEESQPTGLCFKNNPGNVLISIHQREIHGLKTWKQIMNANMVGNQAVVLIATFT